MDADPRYLIEHKGWSGYPYAGWYVLCKGTTPGCTDLAAHAHWNSEHAGRMADKHLQDEHGVID